LASRTSGSAGVSGRGQLSRRFGCLRARCSAFRAAKRLDRCGSAGCTAGTIVDSGRERGLGVTLSHWLLVPVGACRLFACRGGSQPPASWARGLVTGWPSARRRIDVSQSRSALAVSRAYRATELPMVGESCSHPGLPHICGWELRGAGRGPRDAAAPGMQHVRAVAVAVYQQRPHVHIVLSGPADGAGGPRRDTCRTITGPAAAGPGRLGGG
jgi:hypothetical protein